MENQEFVYEIAKAKTLFYMWKGYSEFGDPKLAELELIRRVEQRGKMLRHGPCKICYLDHGQLKFTILATVDSVFDGKSISVDKI